MSRKVKIKKKQINIELEAELVEQIVKFAKCHRLHLTQKQALLELIRIGLSVSEVGEGVMQ